MSAPTDTDGRIEHILDVLLAFARQDFKQRANVSDKLDELDAFATGLNLLAEELQDAVASKSELEAAYAALRHAQAQLVNSGKLVAIGQLASGVAHEINNPASWVSGSVTLLSQRIAAARRSLAEPGHSEQALRESLGRTLAEMEQAADHASDGMERIRSVAGALRTFSRSDAEAFENVSLNDVVDSACRFAAPPLRTRAQLRLQLCGDSPVVSGNRGQPAQVVTNLLVNAADAAGMPGSQGDQVWVRTLSDGAQAVLVVEDQGPGVPPELRDRIFEPFFTTKPAAAGTGLGLSLVADIVHRHGGTVRALASTHGGARFEVLIPRSAVVSVCSSVTPSPSPPVAAGRARVLLVDDELSLLSTFAMLLELDHDVVTAHGGAAALALLEKDSAFDVIFCDFQMPGVDGVQVFQRSTAFAPDLASRFIFCTGGGVQPHIREFAAATHAKIMEKPVRFEQVLETIARMPRR